MVGPAAELPRNLAGRRLGRYEVLTQLASGGMAAVYIARAVGVAGFERLVAIKVLHPHLAYEEEFISMFLDEARVAASIRHPNVVPTLDISDTEGDGFFLVMEYIEGDHFGSLLGEAARGGERLAAEVSARVLLDALEGLGAAHRLSDEFGDPLNLVHRDVSPHNIMVGTDGISRLTDFGVAKAEKRLTSTRAGQLKGKLAYMSPEQASTGIADQRSDLFSMGVLVWEALTGRRLFRGENNAATLNKILHEPIPPPSELWDDLGAYDELLARALHRDPDARFQTADEFSEALEAAAMAHRGVARARDVEKSVRRWLTPRVDAQKERIRAAIGQLGRTDYYSEAAIPIPVESSSSLTVSGSRNAVARSGSMPAMAAGAGPAPTIPPEKEARRAIFGSLFIGGALLLGGSVAWLLASPDQDESTETTEPPAAAETPPEPSKPVTEPETRAAEREVIVEAPLSESESTPEEARHSASGPTEGTRSRRRRRRRNARMDEPSMRENAAEPVEVPEAAEAAVANEATVLPTVMRTVQEPSTTELELNPYR